MFDDQVAVVTGHSQGIGRAVAKRIARAGGRVVHWDTDLPLARASAQALGRAAVAPDVRSWDSAAAACDATLPDHGRFDVLVNAGPNAPLAACDVTAFAEIQAVDHLGTSHLNRAVVPSMRTRNYGRIVSIASVAGKEGNPSASANCAPKAGVIALTKLLWQGFNRLGHWGKRVTPAAARTRRADQMSEEHIGYKLSKIARGRFLELDEAAAMIAWMASRENSFTTGAVFDLSGGRATY